MSLPRAELLRAGEVLLAEKRKVASEDQIFAATVVSDYRLVMLIANWRRVRLSPFPSDDLFEPVEGEEDWDLLWDLVDIDLEAIATLLGVSFSNACALFEQAVALRLIFPDGTVPKEATTAVKGLAAAAIEVVRKRGFRR